MGFLCLRMSWRSCSLPFFFFFLSLLERKWKQRRATGVNCLVNASWHMFVNSFTSESNFLRRKRSQCQIKASIWPQMARWPCLGKLFLSSDCLRRPRRLDKKYTHSLGQSILSSGMRPLYSFIWFPSITHEKPRNKNLMNISSRKGSGSTILLINFWQV